MKFEIKEIGFSAVTVYLCATFCLCVNFWPKTKCHSTLSVLTRFSTVWLLSIPKTQDGLKEIGFNVTTMIQAKLVDLPAEF